MKSISTMLSFFLIFIWIMNVSAVDEKNEKKVQKQKQILVQKPEKKAGLGVIVSNVEDEGRSGALIIEVFKGSEAANIGLQKDDVIIEANGKAVNKPSDLTDIVEDADEGDELQLTILREGNKKTFAAKLKPFDATPHVFHLSEDDADLYFDMSQPHGGDDLTLVKPFPETNKGGYLGIQVKELSDQLKSYFEVKKGVLIEDVKNDSPAEKAGLKAGDVITAINDRDINDHQDLIRTINYYNPDEEVSVNYVRKGENKKLKVKLAKKPTPSWSEKMRKGPGNMHWITDDGQKHIIIAEDKDDIKKLKIGKYDTMDKDGKIEVEKDLLIF